MSTFECKLRRLDRVETHPNADALDLAVVGGYKAVVKRGEFKQGDLALYVGEDSVFTDLDVARALKIDPYLTGKSKNRVKSIKLRGALSQGIVLPLHQVEAYLQSVQANKEAWQFTEGEDLKEELKLEKYEEPIPLTMSGKVRPWPSFLPHYDVENIKRPESMLAMEHDEYVVFTEKIHGTNMTVAHGPGLDEGSGEQIFVCSRNLALKEDDVNVYWRAVREFDLITKLEEIRYNLAMSGKGPILSLSLHGEVAGVQDLKYGCVNGAIKFFAFDMMINGQWVDYPVLAATCEEVGIPLVPVIYEGPYDYDKLLALAEGKTLVDGATHIREGGVVRPINEREKWHVGRINFKFVSEAYLTRKGGSELH